MRNRINETTYLPIILLILSFSLISIDRVYADEEESELEAQYEEEQYSLKSCNGFEGDPSTCEGRVINLEKTFDPSIYGFVLSGEFDPEEISVEVTLSDQSTVVYDSVEIQHDEAEANMLVVKNRSQVISDPKGVIKVGVYSKNPISVDIIEISNSIGNPAILRAADEDIENLQKEFFQNLNLNVVTRLQWGAPVTNPGHLMAPSVGTIVVHHTATGVDNNDPANIVRAIYNDHKNRCIYGGYYPIDCSDPSETWEDIGYNYIIDQNGTIYEGRTGGNGVVGAHSPPNTGTVGISLIGNFENSNPTDAAKESLIRLMAMISKLNDFNLQYGTTVFGHGDRNATACPGANLYALLPSLTTSARNLRESNPYLNSVIDKTAKMSEALDEAILAPEDKVEIYIDSAATNIHLVDRILNETPDAMLTGETSDATLVAIPEESVKKIVAESSVYDPDSLVQPNFKYSLATWDNSDLEETVPSDYNQTTHWNLEKIKAAEAWSNLGGCTSDNTCGGDPSVVIAVLDTGVAYENFNYDAGGSYVLRNIDGLNIEVPDNPTPNGTFNEGYDRIYAQATELTNTNFSPGAKDVVQEFLCDIRSGSAYPCNAAELEKINHANDDEGHGTFVTAIIAANTGDSAPNEIVGIAHNTTILPVKVFFPNDSSMCYDNLGNNDPDCLPQNEYYSIRVVSSTAVLVNAIEYAVDSGADVINLSLTGGGFDPAVQNAINYAAANNVVVVAAAGNNDDDINNYFPASMDNVISVGASDESDNRASYSNYGSKLDLVAPVGSGIASQRFNCTQSDTCFDESGGDQLTSFTSQTNPAFGAGTSFAAPQVSAVVGLIISNIVGTSTSQIEYLINTTAFDIGIEGVDDNTGNGLLNLEQISEVISPVDNMMTIETNYKSSFSELNNILYEFVLGENRRIYYRTYDGISKSNWFVDEGLFSDVRPSAVTYNNRLYISATGIDNKIYTKSYDGVNWGSWQEDGGEAVGFVTQVVYNNQLHQFIRGESTGVFERRFDGSSWTNWRYLNGKTPGEIAAEVYNNRLFIAVRGNSTKIFYNSFNGINWGTWQYMQGETPGNIEMIVYDSKLQFFVTGNSTGVFQKYLDNQSWSSWRYIGGGTPGGIASVVHDEKLYISIYGDSSVPYTRYFETGIWEWYLPDYEKNTLSDLSLYEYEGKLIQTLVELDTDTVFTREHDGVSWGVGVYSG